MFCPNCGNKMNDGATFCFNCGFKVIHKKNNILLIKKIIIITSIVVVAVIGLTLLIRCNGKTVFEETEKTNDSKYYEDINFINKYKNVIDEWLKEYKEYEKNKNIYKNDTLKSLLLNASYFYARVPLDTGDVLVIKKSTIPGGNFNIYDYTNGQIYEKSIDKYDYDSFEKYDENIGIILSSAFFYYSTKYIMDINFYNNGTVYKNLTCEGEDDPNKPWLSERFISSCSMNKVPITKEQYINEIKVVDTYKNIEWKPIKYLDVDYENMKGKLQTKGGKKYYVYENGNYAINMWVKIKNDWYYFNADGVLVVNDWVDNTFYVGKDGKMLKNTTTPDGIEVDGEGKALQKVSKDSNVTKNHFYTSNVGDQLIFTGSKYTAYITELDNVKWEVKEIDDNLIYVLSNKVIYCMPFSNDGETTDYNKSDIKKWLNTTFIKEYLSQEEQKYVKEVSLPTVDDINKWYPNTIPDVWGYADCHSDAVCEATAYAITQGVNVYVASNEWFYGKTAYWLRDKANNENSACNIYCRGIIDTKGELVNRKDIGVRPLIILDKNKMK